MNPRKKLLAHLSANADMLTPAQAARVEAMRKSAGPSGAFAVTTCSLEAVKAMEQAHEALMAAWRDLLEWEQLATNTRKALKEAGKSPDHEPYCPSERGIARTQIVRHAVGRAATELRKHLPQENAGSLPPEGRQPAGWQ